MATYSYPLPKKFDPYYLRSMLEKEFPGIFAGWSETPKKIRIDFIRTLTPTEKSKLDLIIASPPLPATIYELSPITPEDVEKEVGVRPVRIDYDSTTGQARVYFDRALTPDEEAKLEACLKKPLRFRKRRES